MTVDFRQPGVRLETKTPEPKRPVSILARISGRDPDLLSTAPVDIHNESAGVGLALLVAVLIHYVGFVAAFVIFNVPLQIAAVVAAITATGLFTTDRAALHAMDIVESEAAIRRAGGTDMPRLNSRLRGLLSLPLRIGFSVLTALFTGGALTLYMFAADLEAFNERRQIEMDRVLVQEVSETFGAERAALMRAEAEADAALVLHDRQTRETRADRANRIAMMEADVTGLRVEVAELRVATDQARVEAREHRDRMRCELVPSTPTCSESSGIPGEGRLFLLAQDRAAEAEALVTSLGARLSAAEASLNEGFNAVDQLRAQGADRASADERATLADQVVEAADMLGSFEAGLGGRVGALVAANPLREVIDPDSLSARLYAVKELAIQNPAFLFSVLVFKGVAFAFELLAVLKMAFLRRTEYHLLRGRKLAEEMRGLRNQDRQAYLDDAELRAAVRKMERDERNDELATDLFSRASRAARAQYARAA